MGFRVYVDVGLDIVRQIPLTLKVKATPMVYYAFIMRNIAKMHESGFRTSHVSKASGFELIYSIFQKPLVGKLVLGFLCRAFEHVELTIVMLKIYLNITSGTNVIYIHDRFPHRILTIV